MTNVAINGMERIGRVVVPKARHPGLGSGVQKGLLQRPWQTRKP